MNQSGGNYTLGGHPPFSGILGTRSGGGGGAPINAQYLVLALDATLTQERVFTPGTGLSGVDGGAGGPFTVNLANTTVAAGSYTYASITVDAQGRLTSAASGAAPAPTNAQYLTLALDASLTQERVLVPSANFLVVDGGAGGNYSLDLSNTTVAAGSYTYASITVDAKGRLTSAASGAAPVTSVSVDAGELTTTGGTTPTLGLANAGTAGTYAYPASMTTDAFGRVTAVTAGTAPLSPSVATTSASPYAVATGTTTVFAAPVGAQTVQLPAANAVGVIPGRDYIVKRINTSNFVVTVTSAGGTIDGIAAATGVPLAAGTYDSVTVQSDGTNWWIV